MKVIIHTTETGGIVVTTPTPEFLETHTIEEVMAKDCPPHAFIIDALELPQGEEQYLEAWELVEGKIVVNQAKKQAIIDERQAPIIAKQAALNKLMALGLTEEEALALGVK